MPEIDLELYGLRSVLTGGRMFCGVSEEQFAINGTTYKWPGGSHLRWALGFSRLGSLSDLDCKAAVTAALAEISGCCNLTHEYTANPRTANLLATVTRLDGPAGVLAQFQIPVGNVNENTQLTGQFDDGETWVIDETPAEGGIDFYRVALHELLHGHGLGHRPANIAAAALISPTYSRTIRHLQDADKAELVRRYGPAKVVPPASPAPAPVPGGKAVNVTIEQDGKRWSGSVPRVA